jgi:hypothetical protein
MGFLEGIQGLVFFVIGAVWSALSYAWNAVTAPIAGLTVLIFLVYWYLHQSLLIVHKKLDAMQREFRFIEDQFDGLRIYLYSIDPQFERERDDLRQLDEIDEREGKSASKNDYEESLERKVLRERRYLGTRFARRRIIGRDDD